MKTSVVMTVYNGSRYLLEMLDSLRNQTRAAARSAEQMHKTHQIFKAIAVFANKIYHNSASFARVFLKFFRADAGASRFFHPWAAGGSPDR